MITTKEEHKSLIEHTEAKDIEDSFNDKGERLSTFCHKDKNKATYYIMIKAETKLTMYNNKGIV